MAEDKEEQIRRRAYALWEEGGRQSGKDAEHWEQATQEHDEAGMVTSSNRSEKTVETKTTGGAAKKKMAEPASGIVQKKSTAKKSEVKKPAVTKRTSKPVAGS